MWKLALFALLPASVLLLVAEGAAMLTISRRAVVISDSLDLHRTYSLQVGRWPWSRRTRTPLNSLGFAEEEFPSASAPKSCRHVVLTGDSFFFGDGVDRDSSLVEVLRRRVTARNGTPCIKIFNVAVRGSTILQQARRVRESLIFLKPDVVVLGQYQNDLSDLLNIQPGDTLFAAAPPLGTNRLGTRAGRTDRDVPEVWGKMQERLRLFQPHLVRFLSYVAVTWMIEHDVQRDALQHWSVLEDTARRPRADTLRGRYTSLFDSLARDLAEADVAFGVVVMPSKLDLLAGRYPEEAFFLDLAEGHGVPALRTFPLLDSLRAPSPYLPYDGHLNERGNRIVGDAVYRWLFATTPAPFPILDEPIAGSPAVNY